MSFFKKFQEKASIIGSMAKEYYDEGLSYAAQEAEREKKMEKELAGSVDVEPIITKKSISESKIDLKDALPEITVDETHEDENSDDNTETLDCETDDAKEAEESPESILVHSPMKHMTTPPKNVTMTDSPNLKSIPKMSKLNEVVKESKPKSEPTNLNNSEPKDLGADKLSKLDDLNYKIKNLLKITTLKTMPDTEYEQMYKVKVLKGAMLAAKLKLQVQVNQELEEEMSAMDVDKTTKIESQSELISELRNQIDDLKESQNKPNTSLELTELKTKLEQANAKIVDQTSIIGRLENMTKNNEFKDKYLRTRKECDKIKSELTDANTEILKLKDQIKDHQTDNKNCLSKISNLTEEIDELKKNKNQLIESLSNFDLTINKFDDFWKNVLLEHETVLLNLDKQIPIFKNLLKTLDQSEKDHFKPFLQIVAHSLQFLKKIVSLDESYHSEQEKLTNFAKLTNDSLQTSEKVEKSRLEFLEKQVENLSGEVSKYQAKEPGYKDRIRQLESELEDLDQKHDALKQNSTTKELQVVKGDKFKLEEEVEELQDRCDSLIIENDGYKKQVTQLITKIKENEKFIEKLQSRIENEDTQNQIDMLKSTNGKLREEIENKTKEIDSQRTEIKNLQDALTELEESTDTDQHVHIQKEQQIIQRPNKSEVKFEQLYKEAADKISILESKLEPYEHYKSQVTELCAANKELIDKLAQAEKDVAKKAEEKVLKTMKDKNLIDSAMINTFLVQYIRHGDDPSIQRQMLVAMSGILNFSDDEKKVVGLASGDDDEVTNIGAKFIDYLLEDQ